MPGWMPGATIMRGHNAGYRAGRVLKTSSVAHYTVGINSAGIGVQGYFNFLIRRDGEIVQFAESDAVTWHAGNWNSRGPGIEVEYYEPKDGPPPDSIFTDAALESCGRVVLWLHETDGYPLDFHDGQRVSAHHGTVTHRSLIQTGDAHHDYWSHDQWDRMTAEAPPPIPPPIPNPEEDAMSVVFNQGNIHDFQINDNGACVEVYATSPTTWKSRKVFPDGSCNRAHEPRVCKPVAGEVFFVTAVAAAGGGRKRNSARWNGSAYDQVALEVPA